jgi:hypothetical protein
MWSALIVVQVAFAVAVLPAAIKIGIKEIRSSLTRPNYPVEESWRSASRRTLDRIPSAISCWS